MKIHSERIMQKDEKVINDLNFDGIKFPVLEEKFNKIKTKNNICINILL